MKVGLVALDATAAAALGDRLATQAPEDKGQVSVTRFDDLVACRSALEKGSINAVCLGVRQLGSEAFVGFIADVRTTHPLVSICLVGDAAYLEKLPDVHARWRERFQHYYKVRTDGEAEDVVQNVGLLRDLLVADFVKNTALGIYQTTPGTVVQLKAPRPYGFWIGITAALITALIAATVTPFVEKRISAPKQEQQGIGENAHEITSQKK